MNGQRILIRNFIQTSRKKVENNDVKVHYVPTEETIADILTKSLSRVNVEKHRTILFGNQEYVRLIIAKNKLSLIGGWC